MLRWANWFVTASHCVGKLGAADVGVLLPGLSATIRAERLIRHGSADICIVRLPNFDREPAEPFWGVVGNYTLGEEFHAFGWPEEILGDTRPTPRLFTGHFQRFIPKHRSHLGFRYRAGELSIPCPGGLSGGPLFRPEAPQMLTGMVTENLEAWTLLDSVEEVQDNGRLYKLESRRVLTYGLALMLDQALIGWTSTYPHALLGKSLAPSAEVTSRARRTSSLISSMGPVGRSAEPSTRLTICRRDRQASVTSFHAWLPACIDSSED
jgi:hypothetical protein